MKFSASTSLVFLAVFSPVLRDPTMSVGWSVGWLVGQLVGWSVGWLVGRSVGPLFTFLALFSFLSIQLLP